MKTKKRYYRIRLEVNICADYQQDMLSSPDFNKSPHEMIAYVFYPSHPENFKKYSTRS